MLMKITKGDLVKHRLSICKTCPYARKINNYFALKKDPFANPMMIQCKACGCMMNAKARIESSKCPVDKW